MALNRSDKSRILRRYFPGMTRNSEMSTEPKARYGMSAHFVPQRYGFPGHRRLPLAETGVLPGGLTGVCNG